MEYCRLGNSDISVSRICLGCVSFSGYDYGETDEEQCIRTIWTALEQGVNFFDVADVYGFGRAETILGKALKGRRDQAVVATKVGVAWDDQRKTFKDLSPHRLEAALDASLARLGMDCVDLYQIHWPDSKTPPTAVAQELERLRQKGKLLAFGCCNFTPEMVRELKSDGAVATLQMPFSLAERQHEPLLRFCSEKENISTMAYNTLAQGLFTGKYDAMSTFVGTDLRRRSALFEEFNLTRNLHLLARLKEVAGRLEKTPAQIAIRWVLQTPGLTCAVVGAKSERQITENAAAADWHLSEEDYALLAGASLSL